MNVRGCWLYGSGLRPNKCLELRVKDLDSTRGKLTIRQGKDDKDRITMLPRKLHPTLQDQLVAVSRQQEHRLNVAVVSGFTSKRLFYTFVDLLRVPASL